MKQRIVLAIMVAGAVVSCESAPARPRPAAPMAQPPAGNEATPVDQAAQVAELCATGLAKVSATTSNANRVTIGSHTLTLTAAIENVIEKPGKGVAAGVRVMCDVDGKAMDALTAGSVGIDATREDALKTAAGEWAVQYGKPIADALAEKPPLTESGGFRIYAGPVGIRGTKPEQLDINQMFFSAMGPALSTLVGSSPGVHSMTLTLVRSQDGSVDGEFRIDGQVSTDLKARALAMPWPRAAGDYMLKQYYVLLRK